MHEELFGDGEVDTRPKHPLISHVPVSPVNRDVLVPTPQDPRAFMIDLAES